MSKKYNEKILNNTFKASDKVYLETRKLIIGSLALVSALAWNSAFQNFFKNNKFLKKGGPWIYAMIVTSICVITIFIIKSNVNKL